MIKRVRIYSQSPLIWDGTEGAIESVCFNGVSVLRGVELRENVRVCFDRDTANCPQ